MLIIRHDNNYSEERKYIYDVIFNTFLGITYQTVCEDRKNICIEYDGKSLLVDDTFFQTEQEDYLKKISLPKQPLEKWAVECELAKKCFTDTTLPIIYGESNGENSYLEILHDRVEIGIDIFGSAFFMLTRYEEVVKESRDEHDRFSAKDSLAYQEGFLERPIINEYIELLWWSIQKLWPELKRKVRQFRIIPTHDVDKPFEMLFLSPYQIMHTLAGDLLKRNDVNLFLHHAKTALKVKSGQTQQDDFYTFDLIMDISEKHNLQSTFYMMTAYGRSDKDGNYAIENKEIIKLMKHIVARGHKIGIHPSYTSYKSENVIKADFLKLKNVLSKHELVGADIGGRQHFLRWSCPETWQHYEDAGIGYDATLSYADHIGFRCGICYEYPVFNVKSRKRLSLKEKPLVIMECSALDIRYMNLSYKNAGKRFFALKEKCKKYHGGFTILWHNSNFVYKKDIELYKNLLS